MSHHLTHRFADLSRHGRLFWRHLRHGRASFAAYPSRRKAAALTVLFRSVNAYLRGLGVDHTLAFGTLLGWHHANGPLPHDHDIDFAAPAHAFPAIWQARRQLPRGFTMHDTTHRHHGPKFYVCYKGWEADIYSYVEEHGAVRILLASEYPPDSAPFPRRYLYPLRPALFLSEPTFVPAQPVSLLEHQYRYIGPDAVRDPATGYYRPRKN